VSGQGNGLGGCRDGCVGAVVRLAAVGVAMVALFVVLVVASSACAPVDNPPDPNTVSPCAEVNSGQPEGCE
jgi:hypothetical protein